MSSCLELFFDNVVQEVDFLLVAILLVIGILCGIALFVAVYLIIYCVIKCKNKHMSSVLYIKNDDVDDDVLVLENERITEGTEKPSIITQSGIDLIQSCPTPISIPTTLTYPDNNKPVNYSAILCHKEWFEMKQDLFVQERNMLSEFESAYKELMHQIVAWTICQSMKNLHTDHDLGVTIYDEILRSESVNAEILVALKYIDQIFEGDSIEKETSIHQMVEGLSSNMQKLGQVTQEHIKNLEDVFSKRQVTTESYANRITKLLVCVTNHFSKEKSELEVHEAVMTGIDIFCLQLDELWEMSINCYLDSNDLTQESQTLHKQLEDSTEVQKDSLKKRWIQEMAKIAKQGNDLSTSWSNFQAFISESIIQFQSHCHEVIKIEQLITDVVFKEYSLLAEHLGQGHLIELFKKEVALYRTFFEVQEDSTLSKQIMETNAISVQKVKDDLKQLQKQQMNGLSEKLSKFANDTTQNKFLTSAHERDSTNTLIEADLGLTKKQKSNVVALNTALTSTVILEVRLIYGKEQRRIMLDLVYNQNELVRNIIDQRHMLLNLPQFTSIHENIKTLPTYVTKENAQIQQFNEHQKELERSTAMMLKNKKDEVDNVIQQILDENHKLEDQKVTLLKKQEKAFDILKNKLIERLDQSGDKQLGDQLLHEHQLCTKQLNEEMESCKGRQQKLLEQKLQAKKLGRQTETPNPLITVAMASTPLPSIPNIVPWQPGSGTRFAMDAFIQLLHEVRRKNKLKCLEADYRNKSTQVDKRLSLQVKLQLQLKESDLVSKLAKACKLSNEEIKMHLKEALKETGQDPHSGLATALNLIQK